MVENFRPTTMKPYLCLFCLFSYMHFPRSPPPPPRLTETPTQVFRRWDGQATLLANNLMAKKAIRNQWRSSPYLHHTKISVSADTPMEKLDQMKAGIAAGLRVRNKPRLTSRVKSSYIEELMFLFVRLSLLSVEPPLRQHFKAPACVRPCPWEEKTRRLALGVGNASLCVFMLGGGMLRIFLISSVSPAYTMGRNIKTEPQVFGSPIYVFLYIQNITT